MQTFLPWPDLARSAEDLDGPRLGKQRVETLQILRALTFPDYGWGRHPAVLMWRGFEPGLACYGLAMVQAWQARGRADSTAVQLAEFAPALATRFTDAPDGTAMLRDAGELPPWFGDPDFHAAHRGNLVRKDPAHYAPLYPDADAGAEYVWPDASRPPAEPDAHPVPVLRLDAAAAEIWRASGSVRLGQASPRGSLRSPVWRRQLERFAGFAVGERLLLLGEDDGQLTPVRLVTGAEERERAGEPGVERRVEDAGESFGRALLPRPVQTQNPRTLFDVAAPDTFQADA